MKWLRLLAAVVLCNAVGIAGALATADKTRPFYESLAKPPLAPPPTIFGPVWTVLYVLMGVAVWRIWELPASPERTRALALFGVQLVLNGLWSPVFFGVQNLWLALVVIVAMWVAIVFTISAFRRLDPGAAWLLVPYLLWVTFATYLNAGVAVLN